MKLYRMLLDAPRIKLAGNVTLGNILSHYRLSISLRTLKENTDLQHKHELLVGQAETVLAIAKGGFPVHLSLQAEDSAQAKIYQDYKITSYLLISTCTQVTPKDLLVRKSDRKIP